MTSVGNGFEQKVIQSGIVLKFMSHLWEESEKTNSLIMKTVLISTSFGLAVGLKWNGVEKKIQQLLDASSQILTGYAMGNWVTDLVQDLVIFAEEEGISYFWDWAFHSSLCLENDICEVNSKFLFMIQAAKISYCGHEPYLDDSSLDANSTTCHLIFNLSPFYILFGAVGFLLIFVNFFGGGGDQGPGPQPPQISQIPQYPPSPSNQNPPTQPQNPQGQPTQPQSPPQNSETTPESNFNSGDQPQSNNNSKQSSVQRIFAECPRCKREFTQQLSSPFPIICCNILESSETLSISSPISSGIHFLCSNHISSLEALLSIIHNKVAWNLRRIGNNNDLDFNINLRPEDVDRDMIKTILQNELGEFLRSLMEHLCFRCQEKVVEAGLVPNFCPICQTTHNDDEDCKM